MTTESIQKAVFGKPSKKLKIGDRELECYVLEDGKRVLSGRGFQDAIGLGKSHGALLNGFVAQKSISKYISSELAMELSKPIKFTRPGRGGVPANGYEATILPRLCDAILEARKYMNLSDKQREIADQCEIVVRALSTVGIIALVDEVTGYQEVRDRNALQTILDKYVTDEWSKWTKIFPEEFYKELFRLKGMAYPPRSGKKASYVGHWTNDVVYHRLAPGILAELKRKNPSNEKGVRERRHHQHLTGGIGVPKLKDYLNQIIFLMKTCNTYRGFRDRLSRVAPKYNETIPLDFQE